MKQALGLVEIEGLSTAVVVADTMSKAANVQLLGLENAKGLGYMTIKIAGDVGAVNAAVNAGCQVGRMNGRLISWKVIPRPSDYVDQTFCNPTPPVPATPPEDTQKQETDAVISPEITVKAVEFIEVEMAEAEIVETQNAESETVEDIIAEAETVETEEAGTTEAETETAEVKTVEEEAALTSKKESKKRSSQTTRKKSGE